MIKKIDKLELFRHDLGNVKCFDNVEKIFKNDKKLLKIRKEMLQRYNRKWFNYSFPR